MPTNAALSKVEDGELEFAPLSPWTQARTLRLEILWRAGKSAEFIAGELGLTKNQIIGKVHREGFRRDAGVVLSVFQQAAHRKHLAERIERQSRRDRWREIFDARGNGCCWPIGHPDAEDFRFCGRKRSDERPYCGRHVATAYLNGR